MSERLVACVSSASVQLSVLVQEEGIWGCLFGNVWFGRSSYTIPMCVGTLRCCFDGISACPWLERISVCV